MKRRASMILLQTQSGAPALRRDARPDKLACAWQSIIGDKEKLAKLARTQRDRAARAQYPANVRVPFGTQPHARS